MPDQDSSTKNPEAEAGSSASPAQGPTHIGAEDPDTAARLRAILESPTYREADKDIGFLAHDMARAVRLQLDFLKADVRLAERGINRTIVILGSTRLPDPAAARAALAQAEAALARDPADADLRRVAAVAARRVERARYYTVARDLGHLVGSIQQPMDGDRIAVLTGGGPGIMEAANRGAWEAGAESVGLNINLPTEQFPNSYISPHLCFSFHYFAVRKMHFLKRIKALVACPGGYGTFDEVFEALTLVQTRRVEPFPIVLVGESFWRRAFDADFLAAEGMISPEDLALFSFAETAEHAWELIRGWYAARGTPLC